MQNKVEEETSEHLPNQKKLVTKVCLQKTFHHIWLTSEIESADKYVDLFDCLMQASDSDVVGIHINSPGGDLDTALQIIDAIESTAATTVAFIEGQACSAASMIAMACDNVEISEYAYMMIHTFIQGIGGKFSDIQSSTGFYTKWWKNTFAKIYKGFCTPAEIDEILKGEDLWLDAEECIERFNNRQKLREEEKSNLSSKKLPHIEKVVNLIKKHELDLGDIASILNG